jgi:hypothetical protein
MCPDCSYSDLTKLATLTRDHGDRWTIARGGSAGWEAVARPTPSTIVVRVAPDLDQLRTALEAGI